MIWEQHTLVIVMTTRVMERGRPKCHQYWETDVNSEETYGQFIVKTVGVEADSDYTVTTITLTNKKVSILDGRQVFLHFDYRLYQIDRPSL